MSSQVLDPFPPFFFFFFFFFFFTWTGLDVCVSAPLQHDSETQVHTHVVGHWPLLMTVSGGNVVPASSKWRVYGHREGLDDGVHVIDDALARRRQGRTTSWLPASLMQGPHRPTRAVPGWERYAWLAGILFVLAVLAESAIGLGVGINQNDSAAKIATTLADHKNRLVVVEGFCVVYAAMFPIYLWKLYDRFLHTDAEGRVPSAP